MEFLAVILFLLVFVTILAGYPVAFTLGGAAVLFATVLSVIDPNLFDINHFGLLPSRIMGVMNNYVLMAVPLFIFMGVMLQKSGLAENLLECMALLFGKVRGGLAISVVVVGGMLAASTGIVGATVATMGLISLPTMLKRGYDPRLATGVICASGTLGQIIPPSIVLVLLADTISSVNRSSQLVDVGSLFSAAIVPGFILVLLYILYIVVLSWWRRDMAPPVLKKDLTFAHNGALFFTLLRFFILPLILIILVLGSIFAGVASPTEAAAVGAFGAMVLTLLSKKLSLKVVQEVSRETMKLSAMIFFILLGATTFTLVFRELGGDDYLRELVLEANLSPYGFLLIVMLVIFIAGFFIDFIEIIFILVPIVVPLFNALEVNVLWLAVIIALNLQTSFLTPPFGFALFYLKGVAPPEVRTLDIYKGAIPFIIIQLLVMALVIAFPSFFISGG